MKTFAHCLLVFLAVASLNAAPIEKISTLTGKTYRQCEIVKVHPDGVSFTHANGAAKVLFTDLPQEWRTRFGYDPVKAEAFQQEQEVRRKEQAEARQKYQEEQGKALLMAEQIELARLRGNEIQARAALEAAAKAPYPDPPLVPVMPALGPTFDSSDYRGVGYRDRSYGYYPGSYGYGGYSYGAYPIYRSCPPYHAGFGGIIRGRVGGVTFTIGR